MLHRVDLRAVFAEQTGSFAGGVAIETSSSAASASA
jgi:hypothetical protein